ncbi:MAG: hypothetical protein ACPIOQ_03850, partial [Promethearchaeia archaeon]
INCKGISDFPQKRLTKGSGVFLQLPGRRAPRPYVCRAGVCARVCACMLVPCFCMLSACLVPVCV